MGAGEGRRGHRAGRGGASARRAPGYSPGSAMSFRNRLTLFFVLIVVVPMVAVAFVLFDLITNNEHGKADARLAANYRRAIHLYEEDRADADRAATAIGRDVQLAQALRSNDSAALQQRASALLARERISRIVIARGTQAV